MATYDKFGRQVPDQRRLSFTLSSDRPLSLGEVVAAMVRCEVESAVRPRVFFEVVRPWESGDGFVAASIVDAAALSGDCSKLYEDSDDD